MIRIPLDEKMLEIACKAHGDAVTAYVRSENESYQRQLFASIERLMQTGKDFDTCVDTDDWSWVRDFILADVERLRHFVAKPELLQFEEFKKLYINRFSAGAYKYVDAHTEYNAYTFIKNIGITVCPYCDEEYLDVVADRGRGMKRTLEIDHFFPKSKFPALAMCFFNLVPSGQNCNGLKLEAPLGMNPYEQDIEACTRLYPDLPVGINMECMTADDCVIKFHPKKGMALNVDQLFLEERYERHKGKAYDYMTAAQQYNAEKIEEMIRMGFFKDRDDAEHRLFDIPLPGDRTQYPLTKLRKDIVGK